MPFHPDKTSTLLVEHLRDKPITDLRDDLIAAAQNLYYDDFGSDLAFPKIQLYEDLTEAGYPDLATNVTKGIYD
jgi:hypothetical protein